MECITHEVTPLPFNCLLDRHGALHLDLADGRVVALSQDETLLLAGFLSQATPLLQALDDGEHGEWPDEAVPR